MTAVNHEYLATSSVEVDSPIINSPFIEPQYHWQIERGKPPFKAEGRRRASYFYRVPEHAGRGRKKKDQLRLIDTEKGEQVDLDLVNSIRERVRVWRNGIHSGGVSYDGASSVTKELLDLWRSEDRMQRLFFAQVEAAETIIFLVEANKIYHQGLQAVPKDEPGPWRGFAEWMLDNKSSRQINPWSQLSLKTYVDRLMARGVPGAVIQARRLLNVKGARAEPPN